MSTCKGILYQNAAVKTTLAPTDELVVVVDGVPTKMTIADFLIAIAAPQGALPIYPSLKAATDAGLQPGQRFKLGKPNKPGLPPGLVIEIV